MHYITKKFNNTLIKPKIFIYPNKKNYKITLTKSPMAHKTYSQEQFKFNFFTLGFSFKFYLSGDLAQIKKLSEALFLIKYIFSKNLNFSTNMIFLKKFIFIFHSIETSFFLYSLNIPLGEKIM